MLLLQCSYSTTSLAAPFFLDLVDLLCCRYCASHCRRWPSKTYSSTTLRLDKWGYPPHFVARMVIPGWGFVTDVTSDLRWEHTNGERRESGAVFLPAWPGPGKGGCVHVRYTQGGVLEQGENKGTYKGVLNHSIHSKMQVRQHMNPEQGDCRACRA